MKKTTRLAVAFYAAALLTLLTAPTLRAQFFGNNLIVGSNSSGVTTNFTSGTNAYANTFVGYEPGANSNTLNVLNTNTLLTNSGELRVGNDGSSNSLVISNGGTVAVASNSYIGYDTNSSNNSVLVTGTNAGGTASTLQVMRQLYVGKSGSGNSLTVSNGGQVVMGGGLDGGILSVGNDLDSSNNRMVVTGPGSLLSVTNFGDSGGYLNVGKFGSGNSLVISNAGTVVNAAGTIGDTSSASNNSVLVTGANSLWTNSSDLMVGNFGSSNSLVISDGGTVANGVGVIGLEVSSSNNSVLVTDGGTWTNSGGLYVGGFGNSNSLIISNGGTVASGIGYIGYTNTASVLVTGTNSSWNSGGLYVGGFGNSNSLVISNGGRVVSDGFGAIGLVGSNNSVLVTDGGTWTDSGDLYVGSEGSGNSLTISDGGKVASYNSAIGGSASSSNNSVLVSGTSSLWANGNDLLVGNYGSNNTLTVANGGTVAASNIKIAEQAGSSGTMNIGRFGTNDTGGVIIAPTIAFGDGTGAINFNQSDAVTITSVISGAGTLNQLGAGTTTLSASNNYTGATTVSAGQLVVDGSIAGSTVTVNNGGTLAGSGSVGGLIVNSGGTLSPGNSPGNLTVAGNLVWNGGGNYNWQIVGLTGTAGTISTWDLVSATGILNLTALTTGSEFNINLWSLVSTGPDVSGDLTGFDNTQNYTWKIATAAGGITGFNSSYFNFNTGATNGTGGFANALDGGSFSLAQSLDGKDLNLVFTSASAPIPEPGTWAAMAIFAGGAAYAGWRRRKSAKISL